MAEPYCHVDRLPDDLLRDVLHRAAVRLDCIDAGVRALNESGTDRDSQDKWAQIREICSLQGVCKRFYHVPLTVKNLHCRICPFDAEAEILGLANFLSKARCVKGLALTLALKADLEDSDGDTEVEYLPIELHPSLFRNLAESQCFEELFVQAPCLEQFALAAGSFTVSKELVEGQEGLGVKTAGAVEAASNRLLAELAAKCPRLRAIALGSTTGSCSSFPVLAQSVHPVCESFPELRRLCLHQDVRIQSDGQGLSSLLKKCPNLQQLEVERDHCIYGRLKPSNPDYLLLESDSLEVLDFDSRYYKLTLDICTPKFRSAKLGCHSKGAVTIAAPKLSTLEIDCSAKVTVLAPWEQLERLTLTGSSESKYFVWDCNSPLHEALRSCSNLKYLAIRSGLRGIKNVSGLTEGFGNLTELTVHDGTLSDDYESKPVNLREIRKLTVSFEHRYARVSQNKSRLLKALKALVCFPKLESLQLQETGDITPLAVKALQSLQKRQPRLEIRFATS